MAWSKRSSLALLVASLAMGCTTRGAAPPGGDSSVTDSSTDTAVSADTGPAGDTRPPTDGNTACNAPIDVVFVIDVSTSMEDEIEQVRTGMASIWAATSALTTDAHYSLVVFVDDVVAVNGCMAFTDLTTMQAEFDRWRIFTTTNQQPAGGADANLDCAENSLDALYTAATQCRFRPGATHIAIHVTDDTFVEPPLTLSSSFGGGIPVQHTYLETVQVLVNSEIRVGAFAAPGAGEDCGAGRSANVGQGFHEPFGSADSIPDATGGRAWSIRDVRAGSLDMAEAINAFTADEYCTLF